MTVHAEDVDDKTPGAPTIPALPPMTDAEWHELEAQGEHARPDLLDRTVQEDEHPEWYEGPCLCSGCLSYGE